MIRSRLHSHFLPFVLAGLGLLLGSCNKSEPAKPSDSLARVGSHYLTIQQAKEELPDFVLAEDSIEALHRYRQDWIKKQLLLQEANRLELGQKKEIRQKLQKAREEILRQAMKDYIIGSREEKLTITDQEARTYYQAHKDQFALDEEFVKFRHLRTTSIKKARAARRDLLGGVPWPEVARKYARNPEVAINESEQYWPISMAAQTVDIMHRYLKVIGIKEISPIQRRNGVYHFVQLMDERSKGEHPDLNWLIERIKDWMILNKRQRNFSSYVKNLYLKAKSNNEVETFNVLPTKPNPNNSTADTLESDSTNE